jgi:hypothetical protein
MKPYIQLFILIALSAVFMALHEMLSQTWSPMFWLIIISMAIALIPAFLLFRAADRAGTPNWKRLVLGALGVTTFIFIWNVGWALSEEGLIHYYVATYGHDDTGGRYFYPGASGMGYADGLGRPLHTFLETLRAAAIGTLVLGLPFGVLSLKNIKPANKTAHPTAGNVSI